MAWKERGSTRDDQNINERLGEETFNLQKVPKGARRYFHDLRVSKTLQSHIRYPPSWDVHESDHVQGERKRRSHSNPELV